MGWPPASDWVEPWMRAMGRASVYGGLVIVGIWLLCRCLPRMSPAARSWIWRLVYLKLILLVLWPAPFRVPLLPNPGIGIERAEAALPTATSIQQAPTASRNPTPAVLFAPEPKRPGARFAGAAMVVVWVCWVLLMAARMTRHAFATRKTVRESRPLTDPRLRNECETLRRCLGLKHSPPLRSHDTVSSPQVVGLLRPVLLFPASFIDQFSMHEIRLVLAHELAHVRRRDLPWAWLRRLVNGLLFFHPLVWVAHDQATLAEELACDEAALRAANATISDYARTLVRVTEQGLLMPRAATALLGAGMSRAYRMMSRRLQALQLV